MGVTSIKLNQSNRVIEQSIANKVRNYDLMSKIFVSIEVMKILEDVVGCDALFLSQSIMTSLSKNTGDIGEITSAEALSFDLDKVLRVCGEYQSFIDSATVSGNPERSMMDIECGISDLMACFDLGGENE